MKKEETLSAREIHDLWALMKGIAPPKGWDPGMMLNNLQTLDPMRLAFEVGALRDPGRHLTLRAVHVSSAPPTVSEHG